MESTIKTIKRFFNRELSTDRDIDLFINRAADNDLKSLEELKKDVLNEINYQKGIDEMGIRDRIDKPIQQGVVIRFGEITPEQSKKMIAESRRLDGYSNLKKLLKAIDDKIKALDGRKKGYDEMYPIAKKYFNENKKSWIDNYDRDKKPFIEKEIIPHLKEKFPDAKKYPSESHLRISIIEWD